MGDALLTDINTRLQLAKVTAALEANPRKEGPPGRLHDPREEGPSGRFYRETR